MLSRLDPALVLPLLRSAEEDAVVRDAHARDLYPDLATTALDDAIAAALAGERDDQRDRRLNGGRSRGSARVRSVELQAVADRPHAPARRAWSGAATSRPPAAA